ncbi:MAG: hypothetical protein A2506_08520 [Elusimicrobia bacterium RIFOXYD12_FULL_66_9]|nr:MAG: hypothetical protein A2506_08520 [Elusimicrobia bacterium RIFOXYD12_FULL_66_9]
MKSPVIAALLSLPLPGLGHLYCGRSSRGFAIMVGYHVALPTLAWVHHICAMIALPLLIALTARDAWRCAEAESRLAGAELERGVPARRWVLWSWVACRAFWIGLIPGLWGVGLLFIAAAAVWHGRLASGLSQAVLAATLLYLFWRGTRQTWEAASGMRALSERAMLAEIGSAAVASAIAFVLFLIVAPAFTGLFRKSAEGSAKGNLVGLRGAVERYRAAHGGQAPESIDALVAARTIEKIPPVWPRFSGVPHPREAGALVLPSMAVTDSGRWAYIAAHSSASLTGAVFIDCTHTDTRGSFWSAY